MRMIGEKIQKARKAKGLTLEAVQNMTKIRQRYLEAIEAGDFSVIPGEVYIKGFIVNFANVVDLDGQAILGEYYQLKGEVERPASSPGAEASPVKAPPKKELTPKLQKKTSPPLQPKKQPATAKPTWFLPGAILLVLIVGGVITLLQRPASKQEAPVAAVAPTAKPQPIKVENPPLEPVKTDTSVAELRFKATEKVWISLKNQETGRELETVTLKAGDTREWTIDRPLVLRIGNAGGLLVSLRGEEFKTLGTTGQVVSITFAPKE